MQNDWMDFIWNCNLSDIEKGESESFRIVWRRVITGIEELLLWRLILPFGVSAALIDRRQKELSMA